ncbi:MAG: hypothetical protein ACLPPF_20125 [Rhodomicrobium sp.]
MIRRSHPKSTRARSWRVFERRFRPINRPEGIPLWDRFELRTQPPLDVREWWTVIDCDGHLYLSAGFRFVNRFGYVRCEVPWTEAGAVTLYRYD